MQVQTIGTTQPKPAKTFRPLPWQIAPWRDTSRILLLTGSAGGGKSHLAMEKINGFCLKYPGAFAVMARKVKVSMTSGAALFFENEVAVSKAESVFTGAVHLPSKSRFEYANGSMCVYLGLEDRKQLDRLKSIGTRAGVDIAFMEEGTEFEERDYNAMLARLRGKAAGWRQLILATNPDAPTHWINTRLILGGEAKVYYSSAADNTYNPADYVDILNSLTGVDKKRLALGQWVQAEGIIYDTWSDGPADGNVTEAADYIPDGGPVFWGVDDGYSAGSRFDNGLDPVTKTWAADAHPRVIGFYQLRPNGQLCRFEEIYRVKTVEEEQVQEAFDLGYPEPDWAAIDSSAAQLRGRLNSLGIATRKATHQVDEGIKELRRWISPDKNGFRRLLVHPRCRYFRSEMTAYAYDDKDKPAKQFDHGCLVGDTKITTKRGLVSIGAIKTGDYVLTRGGYKRVLACGCTAYQATVFTVHLGNGNKLTGTPDHPVWIAGKGFTRIDELQKYDIITSGNISQFISNRGEQWKSIKSFLTALPSGVIRMLTTGLTEFITDQGGPMSLTGSKVSIGKYGNITTGQYQRDTTFTTKMQTRQTTALKTWNLFTRANTRHCTATKPKRMNILKRGGGILMRSGLWRLSGIVLRKAVSGIVNMLDNIGNKQSQSKWFASSARSLTRHTHHKTRNFVLTTVNLPPEEKAGLMTLKEIVSGAVKLGKLISILDRVFVPVHVLHITESTRKKPVFNLTIEGKSEYFANNVLVHNCDEARYLTWTLRYE